MERTSPIITQLFSFWPLLFTITIMLWLIVSWVDLKHSRRKPLLINTQHSAWFYFGGLWSLSMLIPVSGIIPINGLMYEHWLYLPLIGFYLCAYAIYSFINNFLKKTNKFKFQARFINFILTCLTSLYIILTIRQNYLWANPIRFYNYTLQFAQTVRLHNNLAIAYADQGQLTTAIQHYQAALQLDPQNFPNVYHNLAGSYQALGDIDQAISNYQQALQLDPKFFYSYSPLIKLYLKKNDVTAARNLLEQYQKLFPHNPEINLLQQQFLSD